MPDSPSISSSGYNDGLGRREIGFDRETGTALERLYLRPEVGLFEPDITSRVDRLQALDERFARPIAVERDRGRVVVISEYVAGVRISDLLEVPDALQDAPTLDLALGFLLEALPALATFHTTTGAAHGLISPGRTVLTSSPKLVFLDGAFGDVIGRLHYSRARLWGEFGLAMPPSAGPSRTSVAADIGQVALTALMLVLGRSIRANEYPHGLSGLVSEVSDVALIRGSEAFAAGFQQFLQAALPISSQTYRSAEDAHDAVRQTAELEMGADACSRALTAFIEQIDVGAQPLPAAAITPVSPSLEVLGLDDELAADLSAAESGDSEEELLLLEESDDTAVEQEIVLDADPEPAIFDLSLTSPVEAPLDTDTETDADAYRAAAADEAPGVSYGRETYEEPEPAPAAAYDSRSADEGTSVADEPIATVEPDYQRSAYDEAATIPAREPIAVDEPAPAFDDAYAAPAEAQEPAPLAAASFESFAVAEPARVEEPEEQEEAAPARTSFFSPRRKRDESSRSVRARKDRLRSAAAAFKESVMSRVTTQQPEAPPPQPRAAERVPEPPPLPPPPPPKPAIPPLIPASRAAAFEPPVPEAMAPPPPRPFTTPVAPAVPSPVVPAAAAAPPAPFAPSPPMPVFNTQPAISSAPPTPPQPPAPPVQVQGGAPISWPTSTTPIRLKQTPSSLAQPPKRERFDPVPPDLPPHRASADDTPRQFPWKLAAAAVVIILAGVLAGRAYLPDPKIEQERAAARAAEIAAAAKLPPARRGPAAVAMGKIVIETQPAGAQVLVGGTAVEGRTPLTVERPLGKYVITLISNAGSLRREVKLERAGQTVSLNEQLISGWLAIFAPITFEVSQKGRYVGTTEDGRLMLPPGRHELTLTNKALGYSEVHTVEILPAEVRTLALDPKGEANFNAIPWAEVWVDDQRIGETPIAKHALPLGVHNVVFKNPQYGERKHTLTIRHKEPPVAVSVDLTR